MAKKIDKEQLKEKYELMLSNRVKLNEYKKDLKPLTYQEIGESFGNVSRQTIQRALKNNGITK